MLSKTSSERQRTYLSSTLSSHSQGSFPSQGSTKYGAACSNPKSVDDNCPPVGFCSVALGPSITVSGHPSSHSRSRTSSQSSTQDQSPPSSPKSLRHKSKLHIPCPEPVRMRSLSDSNFLPFEVWNTPLSKHVYFPLLFTPSLIQYVHQHLMCSPCHQDGRVCTGCGEPFQHAFVDKNELNFDFSKDTFMFDFKNFAVIRSVYILGELWCVGACSLFGTSSWNTIC